MGFRTGAYATVWSVESKSPTWTKGRISVTRKNKDTNVYEQEFSGFVDFVGTAAASKAARLKEKDRIKIGDTDVVTKYKAETKETFTNFKIFSFDIEGSFANGGAQAERPERRDAFMPAEFDGDTEELPF